MIRQTMLLGTVTVLLLTSSVATAQAVEAQDLDIDPGIGPDEIVYHVEQLLMDDPEEDDRGGQDGRDGGADREDGATGGDLANGLISSLTGPGGLIALGGLGLLGLLGGAWLLARYVDPKEALDNPQRAMLYGFIRGNPGVHLKQLSDDFDMKTSTVLWHIRKLEAAELVRSQKVNGFRVFYPVAGGIEAKKLGAAVTALTNHNASMILDLVVTHPGADQKRMAEALDINSGTVRWHLRKMRDMGLLAELNQGRACTYYPTDLGMKALHRTSGLPVAHGPTTQVPVALPAAAP